MNLNHLKTDKSGIVLITVLIVSMTLVTFMVGMLSLNVSQYIIQDSQVRRLQALALTEGAYSWLYTWMYEGGGSVVDMTESFSAGGGPSTYDMTAHITGQGAIGPNGTTQWTITTNY